MKGSGSFVSILRNARSDSVDPAMYFAVKVFAVVRRHGNFQLRGALDDVLIGDDVAGRIDDEPRAEALHFLREDARAAHGAAEELVEQLVARIAHGALDDALGVDVHNRGHGLGHGEDRGLGGGIGLRAEGGCRGERGEEQEERSEGHRGVRGSVRHAGRGDVEKIPRHRGRARARRSALVLIVRRAGS